VYAESKKIFPYTEGMAEQILSHGDFASKTHVLHNGVDCDKVEFFDRSANAGPVKVLYAGTIGKANDLTQLLRAIQMIEAWGRSDLEFTILGKGNDEKRVHEEAARMKLKSLKFLPAVGHEEVPRLLRSADIGISCFAPYPVLQANGATKFFDYLASGLPIVINYEGWQAEYLRKWSCGLYSQVGDDQAFARNIVQLADHPDQRVEFARRGRRLAEETFDRRKLAKTYLELIESVVS
jgi:glycosyltransferase involved in cell wall biosynthesis